MGWSSKWLWIISFLIRQREQALCTDRKWESHFERSGFWREGERLSSCFNFQEGISVVERPESGSGPWKHQCWALHPGKNEGPGYDRAVTGKPRSWKRRLQLPFRMHWIRSLPAWMMFSRKVRSCWVSHKYSLCLAQVCKGWKVASV